MKKTIAIAVSMILFLSFALTAFGEADAKSWYCVRNKDHRQPLVGPDLSFAESFGAYYIDHKHGDGASEKVVYLTFDAGYENGNVEKILDVMKEKQVTGAFFVLENLIIKNTELVVRMADEGHLVCNHTAKHPDVTKFDSLEEFKSEIESLENVYREYTGREMSKYFRPPEGRFNTRSLEYARDMGYKTVFWSFAYEDWDNVKQMDREAAKKKILDNMHNGAVILLHPTSATNAAVLGEVIDELKSLGYSFGTLDELTK
ncbi:MAG: delta-lactam-biosynthetic de-N-acetylase [Ruminococcaceae bacterium]|nr:delta-lactam-biosynthetic de-N-acetylase [Oscillospiraceae bacterium]